MIRSCLLALTLTLIPLTAGSGQPICEDRLETVQFLKLMFNEVRVSVKLVDDYRLLELYVSPRGTWTVLYGELESSIVCLVRAGSNIEKFLGINS